MTTVTDDFNRADGGLGASWTTITGRVAPVIASNAVAASTATSDYGARWSADTLANDQYAEADITLGADYCDGGLAVRIQSAANTFYYGFWSSDTGGRYSIEEVTAGAGVSLATVTGVGATGTRRFRLEAVGTALRLYVDERLVLSTTDASITSGSPGIALYRDTGVTVIDNFEAGDFLPDAPSIPAGGYGYNNATLVEITPPATNGDPTHPLITDYTVDYATAAAPTTWLGPFSDGAASAEPRRYVTGLTVGVAYVFRAKATNSIGDSAWSATSASITATDATGVLLLQDASKLLLQNGTDRLLLEAGASGGGSDITVSSVLYVGALPSSSPRVDISPSARALLGVLPRSQPTSEVSTTSRALVGALPRSAATTAISTNSRADVGVLAVSEPSTSNDVTVTAGAQLGVVTTSSPTVETSTTARTFAGTHPRSSPAVEVSTTARTFAGVHPCSSPTVEVSTTARTFVGVMVSSLVSAASDITVNAIAYVGALVRSSPTVEVSTTARTFAGAITRSAPAVAISTVARALVGFVTWVLVGSPATPTDPDRIIVVPADVRVAVIDGDDRVLLVPAVSRVAVVEADDRNITIPSNPRSAVPT